MRTESQSKIWSRIDARAQHRERMGLRLLAVIGLWATFAGVSVAEEPPAVWQVVSPGPGPKPCVPVRFDNPSAVAVDSAENLYVANEGGSAAIQKISSDGRITTLLDRHRIAADGHDAYQGLSLAIAPGDRLVFAVQKRKTIEQLGPDGRLTVLAGQPGMAGKRNGPAHRATFRAPRAVAVDAANNIYVADDWMIRKITASGSVSTLAGSHRADDEYASEDGPGPQATFGLINGLAVDAQGNVYVAEGGGVRVEGKAMGYARVRKIDPTGKVATVAGQDGFSISDDDDIGRQADFAEASGITINKQGDLFVAEGLEKSVRKLHALPNRNEFEVSTIIESQNMNGPRPDASFRNLTGIAVGPSGNLYVTDSREYGFRVKYPEADRLYRIDSSDEVRSLCRPSAVE